MSAKNSVLVELSFLLQYIRPPPRIFAIDPSPHAACSARPDDGSNYKVGNGQRRQRSGYFPACDPPPTADVLIDSRRAVINDARQLPEQTTWRQAATSICVIDRCVISLNAQSGRVTNHTVLPKPLCCRASAGYYLVKYSPNLTILADFFQKDVGRK